MNGSALPTGIPFLSVVTPAFNEGKNLEPFLERLKATLDKQGITWEWIVVDDHSSDETFKHLLTLSKTHSNIRAYRLARNSGSHYAIFCGMQKSNSPCTVVMASDLQDPPETIPQLIEKWKQGSQVVWAARSERHGESFSTLLFSKFYYFLMRKVVGIRQLPPLGADFFLVDARVRSAFTEFRERNLSLFALVTWMGFRQDYILYEKQARLHGETGWTFRRKVRLAIDSVLSFSSLPLRLMSYVGILTAFLGLLYAVVIVAHVFSGERPQGWASLMVVVMVIGGIQMLMLGVMGEYLWRSLDESRRRPRFFIEEEIEPLTLARQT